MRCLSFQVTDTSSKQSVKIFWQLVILKINALSEGKDFVAYLMTFSIRVYLFSLLHERSKKNFDRKQVCPITLSIKRPSRVAALFFTNYNRPKIYLLSVSWGWNVWSHFLPKKAQNISLSCFCKHVTERNDRQTNKQTKERLESRL